jgi:hypothetical protein
MPLNLLTYFFNNMMDDEHFFFLGSYYPEPMIATVGRVFELIIVILNKLK